MKKILQNSLFFILGFVPFCSVAKADTVASPLSYASNVWVGRSEAVIRVLDKLESRSTVFTIPVGEKQQYKGPDDNKTKPSDDTKSTPQDNAASLEQFLKSP